MFIFPFILITNKNCILQKSIASDLSFEAMKRQLSEPSEAAKQEARERQIQIVKTFRESDFDDLVRRTEPKHDVIQNKLNELFNSLAAERQINQVDAKLAAKEKPIYEHNFPELFFY